MTPLLFAKEFFLNRTNSRVAKRLCTTITIGKQQSYRSLSIKHFFVREDNLLIFQLLILLPLQDLALARSRCVQMR